MGERMKYRYQLTILLYVLLIISLLMVYSSSHIWAQAKFNDAYYFLKRQVIFVILGSIAFYICSKLSLIKIRKYYKILLIITYLLLLLVLIPGLGVSRNGSRSWFAIGSFLIQPSEFFKIAMIIYSAHYLETKGLIQGFIKDALKILLFLGMGFLLILLQPDFGSGIVICGSIMMILISANLPSKYLIRFMIIGIIALAIMIISAPYRLSRILAFLDPYQDPLGSGFQMIQSLFAIAPGGLFGVGYDHSMQKHFYLPEPQTDFIFAIYAEEFGLIGCFVLLALYLYLIYLGIRIALNCTNAYLAYCAIGISSLFAIQVIINLCVVVGLMPVTGVTSKLEMLVGTAYIETFRGEIVNDLLFFYLIVCILTHLP